MTESTFFLAQGIDGIKNNTLPSLYNTDGVNVVSKFVVSTLNVTFIVAVVAFMFLIAWGAIQWITSGGDKGGVQSAQAKITNAIIGLVVMFATYAVLSIVGYFFNIPAMQNFVLDLEKIKIQ